MPMVSRKNLRCTFPRLKRKGDLAVNLPWVLLLFLCDFFWCFFLRARSAGACLCCRTAAAAAAAGACAAGAGTDTISWEEKLKVFWSFFEFHPGGAPPV